MHYGTSEQPFGRMATFRMIGKGFEITLYNPEKPTTYYLSLYETSPGKARLPEAQAKYAEFGRELMKPSEKCAK